MKQDVVILGGGVGGLVTASGLSQLGLKVTLIEKSSKLGGDCLHFGCVPSKSLIHVASIAQSIKQAEQFGLKATLKVNMQQVTNHVQSIIDTIQVHDDPKRFESYGVRVLFGPAHMLSPHQVEVTGQTVEGKRIIIATGSNPFVPPIPGIESVPFLTNETIFSLEELPKHLIVLGAGPVGIELAQSFARLGSQVTVIDKAQEILAAMSKEAGACLRSSLNQEGIEFELGADVLGIEYKRKDIIVNLKSAHEQKTVTGSHLLVAAGQRANIDLNLEKAGVQYSSRGIKVNNRLQTNKSHIYAVGDVIDCPLKLTHVAEYQAGVVIANIAFRWPKKQDLSLIPLVVYSDPEVAQVGRVPTSEQEEKGLQRLEMPLKDLDRAIIQGQTQGFMRIWLKGKRIVGALIVGPHAGELISEMALAIHMKAKVGDISATVHAYPTLSQVHRRVSNQYYAPKLFSPFVKKLVHWCQKLP